MCFTVMSVDGIMKSRVAWPVMVSIGGSVVRQGLMPPPRPMFALPPEPGVPPGGDDAETVSTSVTYSDMSLWVTTRSTVPPGITVWPTTLLMMLKRLSLLEVEEPFDLKVTPSMPIGAVPPFLMWKVAEFGTRVALPQRSLLSENWQPVGTV
ncbi:MAG: hypothetical protein QM723_08925 [Myxococcaceae bacterium]